jgi:D-beta-D-heptose 7-phosphate kinase/D-beta-D-heptose 1-phosphate adenosyltransferase
VPVVSLQRERSRPGGAGNVAASLASLGCRVTVGGVVGRDGEGRLLCERLCESGVGGVAVVEDERARTVCKTRVLAGGHQQMLRLDQDGSRAAFEAAAAALEARVFPLLPEHQVVVLADYDKGTLPEGLIRKVVAECRRRRTPCVVDPKKADFSVYAGATLLAPNVFETERALGSALADEEAIGRAALGLRARLGLEAMLITRGPDGMTLAHGDQVTHFPAKVREVADVTGAGDTVVAVLAACLAAGCDAPEACRVASLAAGIAVSKPGTYAVKAGELEVALRGHPLKVLDWQTARAHAAEAHRAGRRVVFTNGCFDILHAGHLSCLERARALGDLLVVGLNSDGSVRRLKGPNRPVNPEGRRAALLAGLACVDVVVLFEEDTPEDLVRCLRPDVLVKGGDYRPDNIAGADFVRAHGGEVVILPHLEGLSSTSILTKGANAEGERGRVSAPSPSGR